LLDFAFHIKVEIVLLTIDVLITVRLSVVRMYYMIIMLKFMEPEAEVKLVQNFYYKIYLVCNWEAGKEVLQPAPVNSLRLRRRCLFTRSISRTLYRLSQGKTPKTWNWHEGS